MTRLKNDQYFTPPGLIYPLLKELALPVDATCFEPCAGDGAIVDALANVIDPDNVIAADIDLDLTGLEPFDATDAEEWDGKFIPFNPDWVITNPPYKQPDCDQIIQNAWDFAEVGIAMLLRLSYLEPCQNRAKFLQSAPLSNLIIFNPRPQFIPGKKATDSSTVAWFVWRKPESRDSQITCKITYCTNWHE